MASPPGSAPFRERDSNPELVAAAESAIQLSLRGSLARARQVAGQKKAELRKQQGVADFFNLLDKLNIEQGVANRAMMADYLDPKRFVWVFFADSFLWPFDNRKSAPVIRQEVYMPLQEKMLHRWMEQEKLEQLPSASTTISRS